MIYFIQTDDNRFIKIGRARDVEKRFQALQIGHPGTLKILAVHQGDVAEERIIHKRFAANKVRGEWFHATPVILDFALNGGPIVQVAQSKDFCRLAAIEPRLIDLAARVGAIRDDQATPWFCANDIWYRQYKPSVERLAGHYAETLHPRLRTSEAYDIVYDALYELLPHCRNCGCL